MSTVTATQGGHERWYLRIPLFHRVSHFFLMLSFIGLAGTGLAISFSDRSWAQSFSEFVGGFPVILYWHKLSALVLSAVFAIHLVYVFFKGFVLRDWGVFWGPGSMVPNLKDGQDIVATIKWFFGRGPRAKFDELTYFEKFDYWAVFWGMFIIGGSGYMLWFSGQFAQWLPGWLFNIAFIVHSEEALLAIWFIFTIHFFNNHLRLEKFPMDLVFLTGKISEHELKEERAGQVERLAAEGKPPGKTVDPPSWWMRALAYIIGTIIVLTGFALAIGTLLTW